MKHKPKLHFRFPKKLEFILLFLATVFLFWTDILQNKIQDLGIDYQVHVTTEFKLLAINLFYFTFIITFLLILALTIRSILIRGTYYGYDFIGGFFGLLGLAVILTGATVGFSHPVTYQIPLFTKFISQIAYYHIGIAMTIASMVYFTITE